MDGPHRREFLPCIWMSAGLVAYKLCERDLECEGCAFDDAMRGAAAASATGPEGDPWSFPEDRRYHRGHAWSLPVGSGHVRVGLDILAARLLAGATAVVLPALGGRVRCGRVACWFREGEELIPLRAPATGRVVRHNPRARNNPRILASDPYGTGWLFDVELEGHGDRADRLLSAAEIQERAERQLARLSADLGARVARGSRLVGTTLPDGGERLADLRAILGAAAHARLVASLLR